MSRTIDTPFELLQNSKDETASALMVLAIKKFGTQDTPEWTEGLIEEFHELMIAEEYLHSTFKTQTAQREIQSKAKAER